MKKVILVIDIQNDLCDKNGKFAKLGLYFPHMDKIVENIAVLIKKARKKKIEIIFVKSIGNEKYLYDNIRKRLEKYERKGYLLENKWGSEIYRLPVDKDKIIKKIAYSAFSNNDKFKDNIILERYIKSCKIKELVLVGCFADICINLTAKDAYEKGFFVTIIKDCVAPLEGNLDKSLTFMQKYYGAKVCTLSSFFR